MKTLFLAAVAISALSIGATTAIAGHHEGGEGHKKKMMERVDTDGDGQVSKAELMAKHDSKFMKMDLNGDGLLSKDEMKDAKSKMKEKREMMRDKIKDKMEDKAAQ